MKNNISFIGFIIICSLTFTGCKKNYSEKKPIKSESKKIDSIFLDYTFGMTPEDFELHTRELIKDKKLNANKRYDFPTEPVIFTVPIGEYYNNKLYKLTLPLKCSEDYQSTKLTFLMIANVFVKKYSFQNEDKEFYFIHSDNNLKLGIYNNIDTPFIEYLDRDIDSIINLEKEKIEKEKQNDI